MSDDCGSGWDEKEETRVAWKNFFFGFACCIFLILIGWGVVALGKSIQNRREKITRQNEYRECRLRKIENRISSAESNIYYLDERVQKLEPKPKVNFKFSWKDRPPIVRYYIGGQKCSLVLPAETDSWCFRRAEPDADFKLVE